MGKNACLFAAIMITQDGENKGTLCILIEVISISDVCIYAMLWREINIVCLGVVFYLSVFNAFNVFPSCCSLSYFPCHFYRCISLISGLYSHDLRIMVAILQNRKPNGAVVCRRRETSIMLRPE